MSNAARLDRTACARRVYESIVPADAYRAGLVELQNALDAERARRAMYEHVLARMPLALMFVDGTGAARFANDSAEEQCGRWNRALRGSDSSLRLPENLDAVFEGAVRGSGDAADGPARPVLVAHPALNSLAAQIDRVTPPLGLQTRPSYVVTFCDRTASCHRADDLSPAALTILQRLSACEQRVARLVACGLRNEKVAERISRSPRTVEFQLSSIYRKLGIASRAELVRALS